MGTGSVAHRVFHDKGGFLARAENLEDDAVSTVPDELRGGVLAGGGVGVGDAVDRPGDVVMGGSGGDREGGGGLRGIVVCLF